MIAPFALLLLAATGSNQFTPTFPGAIVAWIVCNTRKKYEFGGWLLFFYWQLYSGVVMTTIFFLINFQSYVPENFGRHPATYYWFLASALPNLVIFVLQVAVGTILLSVRTWDLLVLLRGLIAAQVIATIAAIVIDVKYFPENVALNIVTMLVPQAAWLAYFCVSKRVRHVFQAHDWDTAVESFYPTTKLGLGL